MRRQPAGLLALATVLSIGSCSSKLVNSAAEYRRVTPEKTRLNWVWPRRSTPVLSTTLTSEFLSERVETRYYHSDYTWTNLGCWLGAMTLPLVAAAAVNDWRDHVDAFGNKKSGTSRNLAYGSILALGGCLYFGIPNRSRFPLRPRDWSKEVVSRGDTSYQHGARVCDRSVLVSGADRGNGRSVRTTEDGILNVDLRDFYEAVLDDSALRLTATWDGMCASLEVPGNYVSAVRRAELAADSLLALAAQAEKENNYEVAHSLYDNLVSNYAQTRPAALASSKVHEVSRRLLPTRMRFLRTNPQGFEEYLWPMDSSVMVKIPAGAFLMGSQEGEGESNERPRHQVTMSEYYVDKCEVTNRQFEEFVKATGYRTDAETMSDSSCVYDPDSSRAVWRTGVNWRDYAFTGRENHPVVLVSWNDANAYCDWVGRRLPTEAEWEKAARGTDARKYPWGDAEPHASGIHRANWAVGLDWDSGPEEWKLDGYGFTAPVGHYPLGVSPYGCLDMAGNVREWCQDRYSEGYYRRSPGDNPQGPTSGSVRVIRDGSWFAETGGLRSARRGGNKPSLRSDFLGFRCTVGTD
ncbi:formylglycine-generating enzyme family protein [candidate division WOR-3 bacterium]|uniref:Formylglycine-generating enzyme family protein n=1 Tax=candidate division WOR-3 bacterium TaxID=2052148 RepID=A0A937XGJ1_UNCW3|nr:formylglycine-generating enzyme family protein [candidate division WOR-3 bacterium]